MKNGRGFLSVQAAGNGDKKQNAERGDGGVAAGEQKGK
jgi:hypothetical protein